MTAINITERSKVAPRETSRLRSFGVWFGALALFAVLPLIFASGTSLTMMSIMGVMIVFALSYNMLLGQTGLLSFGHAVYYGLAGFVTIHVMNTIIAGKYPIPLPAMPIVGGLAGLFFGIIFGSVSTRRAGTVFAMISLGLAELVAASSLMLRGFFGGEEGIITDRTKLPPFFGYTFGPQIQVYYLVAIWCLACIIAMYAITRTPFGRMCNAVRENPERVQFVGYRTQTIRFIAFSLAGFFAGIAGALAAINFELMNSQSVGAAQSSLVLLMTYVGGTGVFVGPIVGAVLITFLQIFLSDVTGAWLLYFGLMFIVVVMFIPGGIAGWVALHEPIYHAGKLGRLLPSYVTVAAPLAVTFIGAILLIELAHHALVMASTEGGTMQGFGFTFDSGSPVPWIVVVVLLGGGTALTRALWPRVSDAWAVVTTEILRRNPT
jgi:branched-chain amino acid transport system permease protein